MKMIQMLKSIAFVVTLLGSVKSFSSQESLYDFLWLDPDKKVYVLQNKQYFKKNKYYIDLGYLRGLSSQFSDSSGGVLSGSYYFTDQWGVEFSYYHYKNKFNDDYKNVRNINDTEPFVRELTSSLVAALKWSPFYGKINTFNKIIYFDLILSLGLSSLNTRANLDISDTNTNVPFEDENSIAGFSKVEVKAYVSKTWNLGVYASSHFFNADGPRVVNKSSLKFNNDLIFYVGVSF